ncbi:Protein EDS1B [Diplonema papillatum]|nr:Protein EDS1B [Diplonema papillatum]
MTGMSGASSSSTPTAQKRSQSNLELPLWNKVYSAHRLSILAYMPKETTAIDPHTGLKNSVMAWRNGERIDLGLHVAEEEANIGKVPAEHDCYSTLEPTEFDPIKVVCFGDKRPDGFAHRVQWLAARRNNILYIAFKGTNNGADMLIDASITDVIAPSGARYHSGFYAAVQPELADILRVCNVILMDDANCVEDVVFCGHSLGGAYATVAALELAASPFWKAEKRPEAVTFGAPLVVTQSANGHANVPSALLGCMPRMTHFVANYDIVPRMLALKPDSVLKMAKAVPDAILQDSGYLKTWSVGVFIKMTSPIDKIEGMIQQAQVLREQYVAVGTYVFAITSDNGRQAHVQVVPPMKFSFTSRNMDADELLAFYPHDFDHKDDAEYLIRKSLGDHRLADSYWPAVRLCTLNPTPDPDDGDRRQWDDIRDHKHTQAHVQVVPPMKFSFTSRNMDADELLAFYPHDFDHKDDAEYLIRKSLGDHRLADSYWPAVRLCTLNPTPDPDDGDRRQWDDIRDHKHTQAHVQVVPPMKFSFTSRNMDADELLAFYPHDFDHKDDAEYLIRRSLGDHKLADSYWPAVRLCTFSPTPDPDDGDRRQWDDIRDQIDALKSRADEGSDITEKELWAAYTPSFLYSHALPPHMLSETLSGEAKELTQKVRADALRLAAALTEKRREVLGLNDKTHVDFLGGYSEMNTDVRPPPPHVEEEPKSKKRFSLIPWRNWSRGDELDKSQHVLSPVISELETMHKTNGYPLFVVTDN